jgi:hypothetical protein
MKFARWVFIIAGVYGIIIITPMFFSEYQIGINFPPAITHPEYFYGFACVALIWQILFLFIAVNPIKYRLMIIPSILEKISAGIAVVILFMQHRIPAMILSGGVIDLMLGLLFIAAFLKAKEKPVSIELAKEFESNQEG